MIQFNLLPDVKIEYVKAQRTKRMVMGAALIATAVSFAIFLMLLLTVNVVQKKNLGDLDKDIKKYGAELKATPDLDKILTIQNQLRALNGLHDQKPVGTRSLPLLQQLTPTDVTISDYVADFELKTMTVTGEAASLDRVNTFVDTLKFARYSTPETPRAKAFPQVVLSQFSRSEESAQFTITATYDEGLFNGAHDIKLEIPKAVTTRSVTEQPTDIFKKAPAATNRQGN